MHVLSRVLLGIVFALGGLIVMDSSLTAQELPGESTPGERKPMHMSLQYMFGEGSVSYKFVLEGKTFETLEAFKKHLETLPEGTHIRWDPGCKRMGGEPLLNSEEEMRAFEAFLAKEKLRLELVPSG